MASAVEAERHRIGQDLHDSVGQVLTAMGLRLAAWSADSDDDDVRRRFAELLTLAELANEELRASVDGLLFGDAAGRGLEGAVRALAAACQSRSGIVVDVEVRGHVAPVDGLVEEALYRMANEALRNVERHSGAARARVSLRFSGGTVALTVQDDGVGLRGEGFERAGHFGIRAMRRRLEDVGGDLVVHEADGGGLCVEALVPGRKRTAHVASTRGGRR